MFEFISFLSFGGIVSLMAFAKVMIVVFGLLAAFAAVVEIVDVVLEADASDENIEVVLEAIVSMEAALLQISIDTLDERIEVLEARLIETGAEEIAVPMDSKVLTPFWGEIMGIVPVKGSYPNPLVKSQWQQLGELLSA